MGEIKRTSPFEALGVRQMQFVTGGEVVDPTIDIPDNSGVYGFRPKGYGRPELLAPSEDDAGGFLFLPGNVKLELIDQLVDIADMGNTPWYRRDQYGVQILDAPDGLELGLGYMRKLVIADYMALKYLYEAPVPDDHKQMPRQPVDVSSLVRLFVEEERSKYGTFFGSEGLAGKFGGDGYLAQEALGFGFAIENKYHRLISVWSRGWLCTK